MQVHGHPARHFPLNYISGTVLAIIILLSGLLGVAILSVTDNLPNVFDDDNAVSVIVPAPSIAHPTDRGVVRQGMDAGAVTLDGNLNAFTEAREGGRIAPALQSHFEVGMGEGRIAGSGDLAIPAPEIYPNVGPGVGLIDGSGSIAVPDGVVTSQAQMQFIEDNVYLPTIDAVQPKAYFGVGMGEGLDSGSNALAVPDGAVQSQARIEFMEDNLYLPTSGAESAYVMRAQDDIVVPTDAADVALLAPRYRSPDMGLTF